MTDYIIAVGIVGSVIGIGAAIYGFFWSGQAFSCPTHLGIRLPWAFVPVVYLNRGAAPLFFEAWLKYRACLRRSIVGGLEAFFLLWWWTQTSPTLAVLATPLTVLIVWNLLADARTIAVLRRSPVEETFLKRARQEYDLAVRAH